MRGFLAIVWAIVLGSGLLSGCGSRVPEPGQAAPGAPSAAVAVDDSETAETPQVRPEESLEKSLEEISDAPDMVLSSEPAPEEHELAQNDPAAAALAKAKRLQAAGRVFLPARENAATVLAELLHGDPEHIDALVRTEAASMLDAMLSRRIEAAFTAAAKGEPKKADAILAEIGKGLPAFATAQAAQVQDAAARITELREQKFAALKQQFLAATATGDEATAEPLFARIEREALRETDIDAARDELERVRHYGKFAPGQQFNDALKPGGYGPDMVVLPHGRFQMGTPDEETLRNKNESPRHKVRFKQGFALARTETTVGQFRAFIQATGYKARGGGVHPVVWDEKGGAMIERRDVDWENNYAGRRTTDDAPVLYVTWEDARAYADWLAQSSGARYALPSEAQFEYALRANGASAYPWGEAATPPRVLENLTGEKDVSPGGRRFGNVFAGYGDGHWGPAPVGSFTANAFGVFDMNGNVAEWVEDCWHDNYNRAPTDGSAWVNPGCIRRVIRGASWATAPEQARSGFRLEAKARTRNARLGFRVMRELF